MHVHFKSQGDIMKLGLERSSLSGAFLETLPPISILFHFHLNYTDLFIALKLVNRLKSYTIYIIKCSANIPNFSFDLVLSLYKGKGIPVQVKKNLKFH